MIGLLAAAGVVGAVGAVSGAVPGALNDYPTETRAGYVFTCMAGNGQTPKALSECSCAIDHIASVLPYADYVSAETVAAMRQTSGERAELFRSATAVGGMLKKLQTAEAEAEILCFTPGN